MFNIEDFRVTDERLDKLAELCRCFIDNSLEGDSDSMMPQVIVEARGPMDAQASVEITALAIDFNTHVEKHAALHRIGASLYARQRVPLAVCLISEAWIATWPHGERQYLLPEDDPKRREGAIYNGLSLDGRVRHGVRPIKRDKKQIMTPGGEWQIARADAKISSQLVTAVLRGFVSNLPAPFSDELLRRVPGG